MSSVRIMYTLRQFQELYLVWTNVKINLSVCLKTLLTRYMATLSKDVTKVVTNWLELVWKLSPNYHQVHFHALSLLLLRIVLINGAIVWDIKSNVMLSEHNISADDESDIWQHEPTNFYERKLHKLCRDILCRFDGN